MPDHEFTTPDTLPGDRPIAIYGAGENGLRLLRALRDRRPDVDVACFLDTYKSGELAGLEVRRFDPDEARAAGFHVVVASYMWSEIRASLAGHGLADHSVCDPNLSVDVLADQLRRVVECRDLFKRRTVLQGPASGIPEADAVWVLHDSPANPRLDLPNAVWEGAVNHHDPEFADRLFSTAPGSAKRNALAVLVQHADLNTLFLRNCLKRLPEHVTPYVATDVPRRSKAFCMPNRRALYVPLPKCASSTILGLLQASRGRAGAIHEYTGPDSGLRIVDMNDPAYEDWFKFTFVRHPLRRVASLYNFHASGMRHHILHHLSKKLGKAKADFAELVRFVRTCPDCVSDPHFRSMHRFVTNSRGVPVMDFVGRVDRFDQDWRRVSERLGLDPRPRKRNVSRARGTNYDALYDPELRDMVLSRYREDMRLFFNDSGESCSQSA